MSNSEALLSTDSAMGRSLSGIELHEELSQKGPIEWRGDDQRIGARCLTPSTENVLASIELIHHLGGNEHAPE